MESSVCVAWGFADDGQLGIGLLPPRRSITPTTEAAVRDLILGDRAEYASTPSPVAFPKSVIVYTVSAGSRHTLAVTSAGLFSFGWNQCGQLGIGSFEPRNEPCLVTGLEGLAILTASAGGFHSAVLTSNGIYTFGGSQYGQLGDLPPTVECSEPTPRRLTALHTLKHTWVDVQCGGTHTAALAEDGSVYTWGRGDSGQLGVGLRWREGPLPPPTLGTPTPTKVEFPVPGVIITQLSLGAFHTACVDSTGGLWTFGKEDYGVLGYTPDDGDQHIPKCVPGLAGHAVRKVSAGGWHTMCICDDGVYAFGRGDFGRLGLGDTAGRLAPTKVEYLAGLSIADISCGGSHTVVLDSTGEAYAFGRGDHGRLGIGRRITSYVPVSVHLHHEDEFVLKSPLEGADSSESEKQTRAVVISSGGTHTMALLSTLTVDAHRAAIAERHASHLKPSVK